jgi:hypothetical protein
MPQNLLNTILRNLVQPGHRRGMRIVILRLLLTREMEMWSRWGEGETPAGY